MALEPSPAYSTTISELFVGVEFLLVPTFCSECTLCAKTVCLRLFSVQLVVDERVGHDFSLIFADSSIAI